LAVLSLLIASLAVSPPAARAAHWVVTYQTNGTTNGTDYGNNNQPYTTIWPVAGPNGGGSPPSGYGSGMETSHGTVTPVLTWTLDSGDTVLPPAPDPAEAVIYVSITASIDGNNGRGTSPCHTSTSDSFGDSFTTTTSGTQQTTSGAFCHLAQMSNSGGSTQVNLPAITLDAVCSTDGPNAGGSTTINVVATPVNIVLGGVTVGSGQNNILVGQGCSASWVPVQSGGRVYATLSNYNWTVPGNTFQSWTASSSSAVLSPGYGDPTQPTVHWYWSDTAAKKTVTCTATATPPPGLGAPFSVTSTQTVNLEVPLYSATPSAGRVQINASYPNRSGYWLYAGEGNPGPTRGMQWKVRVPTPTDFAGQSGGGWYFDQIVTPGRWKTPFGGSEKPWPINGMVGLDKSHPYPPPAGSPIPPPGMPTGSFATDGSEITSGDSPAQAVDNNYTNYRVMESFKTYVMYVPPGSDVQPVPLHEIDWNWKTPGSTGVQKPDGGWSNWPDGTDAGTVTSTSSAKQTVHPVWTQLSVPPASW